MAQPVVSWWARDNGSQQTKWEIGTIDAGSISQPLGVLIWNNRKIAGVAGTGDTDLSTMTNCTITTKDASGGDTGELVKNTWIEAKIDSMGELDFVHKIGGTATTPIQAGGNTSNAGGTFSPNLKEILGVKNDGTKTNSAGNYCEVSLRANIPATATAGNVDFLTRVAYQYV